MAFFPLISGVSDDEKRETCKKTCEKLFQFPFGEKKQEKKRGRLWSRSLRNMVVVVINVDFNALFMQR